MHTPRVVIAGTNSGCGKTTVTCGILQALVNRNLKAGAFKCGPDYIDPMFHSRIIGIPCSNLDLFFLGENTARFLLQKNSAHRDFTVIEGVMGFYDGLGLNTVRSSTYELAKVTDSPVILVINSKGLALSVLAILEGFANLHPDSHIRGVILNGCTAMTYSVLAETIREHFKDRIQPLGYLPMVPECSLESRHLGLVTAAEVENLQKKMQILAEHVEKSIDIDGILKLGMEAPPVSCREVKFPRKETVRIGVAEDRAFCFYYEDNLAALREMGAQIVKFSPLEDPELPQNIQGLYLGGGYPELYAKALGSNRTMLQSVRAALEKGMPCIAECGGFMYLTESIEDYPMVGYLPGKSYNKGKLTRFGYVTLTARKDNMLCRCGEQIPAHEFHHWDVTEPGRDFTAQKLSGKSWECAYAAESLYAGYPHFHFYGNPHFAMNFYDACRKELHNA